MMRVLKSSELWRRFVVRGLKSPKSIVYYIGIVSLLISCVDEAIKVNGPILNLEKMKQHSGVIENVYTTGKNRNRWISLRLNSGETAVYNLINAFLPEFNELQKLQGESVTLWSQSQLSISPLSFGYSCWVRQVQYKDTLVINYEGKVRPFLEDMNARGAMNYVNFLFLVPLICFFTLLVWRENAKPDAVDLRKEG